MEMKMISLYVPESLLRDLDILVKMKLYPNRAEAIRLMIRDGVNRDREGLKIIQDVS